MTGRAGHTIASVYVHAPFCARRCAYCDFAVSVRADPDPAEWIEAIAAELDLVSGSGDLTLSDQLDTLYVGGGTPSLLGPRAMTMLRDVLGPERLTGVDLEWTAEANPESFTEELAHDWAAAGVNRISLGAQTFSEVALRWMGRLHGPEGPERAVASARAAGLTNVSVDLIFALPDSAVRDWGADLSRAIELDVPHVSLYGLTVEQGTHLGRAVEEGRESTAPEGRYRDEYFLAVERLTSAGYEHYEVSNFARPGFRARHNAVYWSGDPYVGVGNGAHSYLHPVRRWNERSWDRYREALGEGRSPEVGRETIDPDAARLEEIWLGLRTDAGLPIGDAPAEAVQEVEEWVASGMATLSDGVVRLTTEGWLLLDDLAVRLEERWADSG